jgi:hypothetical protein
MMGNVSDLYHDKWITCTDDAIVIKWYYLWGSKRIRYTSIRSATQVNLSALRGKARVWGTSNPRYWASLDLARPGKSAALILDVGGPVKPFITPDDVPAVAEIVKRQAHLDAIRDGGASPVL